jgi:metallo-beta-lactamase class B
MKLLILLGCVTVLAAGCGPRELEPDAAIDCERCVDWNAALDPFRVYGNTWYVGTDGLASILIETDDGLVLIDGGLPQSASSIVANIVALGFEPHDIEAILVSHPHFDHVGGINALQRMTRAMVYTSEAGRVTLTTGALQADDPQYVAGSNEGNFPPVRNVTVVGDGAIVSFGSVDVRAVYTPGHSAGSVSWSWQACALGTCYQVVYADSLTSVSAPQYSYALSGAAEALTESAAKIADLDCDILLSPHPFFFAMHDKLERIDEGNPFVNGLACTLYAEEMLGWLEQRLAAERR